MTQITIEELQRLFPGASISTLKRNLEAHGKVLVSAEVLVEPTVRVMDVQRAMEANKRKFPRLAGKTKRLRQDSKPLLNQLETEFLRYLQQSIPGVIIRSQAKTFRLANGVTYRPDFTGIVSGEEHAWEVKGKKVWDDAIVKIKVAAASWPEVVWWFCWKTEVGWNLDRVLS